MILKKKLGFSRSSRQAIMSYLVKQDEIIEGWDWGWLCGCPCHQEAFNQAWIWSCMPSLPCIILCITQSLSSLLYDTVFLLSRYCFSGQASWDIQRYEFMSSIFENSIWVSHGWIIIGGICWWWWVWKRTKDIQKHAGIMFKFTSPYSAAMSIDEWFET